MNDISVFDHPKPNLAENTVCELLRRDYGMIGTLKPLVSERGQKPRYSRKMEDEPSLHKSKQV